jgi:four helix bundle protein
MSVPAHIAEGYGRRDPADKARLSTIGQGSYEELSDFLTLAQDLGYAKRVEALQERLDGVGRRLRLNERTLEPLP